MCDLYERVAPARAAAECHSSPSRAQIRRSRQLVPRQTAHIQACSSKGGERTASRPRRPPLLVASEPLPRVPHAPVSAWHPPALLPAITPQAD